MMEKNKKLISFDIETMGLSSHQQPITTICATCTDGVDFAQCTMTDDKNNYLPGLSEADVLDNFLEFIKVYADNGYELVSKNGNQFDIPYILTRCYLLGIPQTSSEALINMTHYDVQEFTSRRVGLQQMAEMYGLGGKLEKGSFAPSLWTNKDYERLVAYCLQDALLTLKVYHKFKELNKE